MERGFASIETQCVGGGGGDDSPGAAPSPNFTVSPSATVEVGQAFSFDASVSQGTGLSFFWDFGDGADGTGVQPTHTYGAAGSYTVTLTATDQWSQTASYGRSVTVEEAAAPESYFVVITPVETTIQPESNAPAEVVFTAHVENESGQLQSGMPVSFADGMSRSGYVGFGSYSAVTNDGAGHYFVTVSYSDVASQDGAFTTVTATANGATHASAVVNVMCAQVYYDFGMCH